MSSNNGGISSATNGRSGSTGSHKTKATTATGTGTGTGTGAITGTGTGTGTTTSASIKQQATSGTVTAAMSNIVNKTLPDLKSQRSSAANENNKSHIRRDSTQIDKDKETPRKQQQLQYALPQTLPTTVTTACNASEAHLVYCAGKLQAGTLDALIQHMVPTHEYYPEHSYLFAFLLSARLFIRPHELLAQISQTWELQQKKSQSNDSDGGDVVDDAGNQTAHHHQQRQALALGQLINSASPLTQRKASSCHTTTSATSAELEPKPLQRTVTQRSAQHCILLLSEWIEIFPYDFRDERLMQQVRILARKCVYIDNSLGKQVSRILQLLVARLTSLEQYEDFLQTLNNEANANEQLPLQNNQYPHQHHHHHHHHHLHNPFQTFLGSSHASSSNSTATSALTATAANGGASSGASSATTHNNSSNTNSSGNNSTSTTPQPDEVFGIMDICPSCAHLAHQLTAIELERLSHIGPEEFVQAFAKDYQQSKATDICESKASTGGSNSLNDMKKTRNLESYVEWFNRLSYLTATEIVKYPKKKQRVRIIEYWIETARECFNIGNFNSLMAIIAGLNLAPIGRLKKTWSKVQSAKFSVLEHQMDPTSNFNSYRSTLKAAMWRSEGATEERERIIIPFFSLFVKDLYFLNEGCSNRLPNNHINFEKCSQLAKQVMDFNEWKKVTCPFEKLPNVIAYLQHNAVLNDTTLSMASFECEPPENTEEKDRYKTVKAETKQQLLQQLHEQQQQQQQQ